MSTDTYEKRFNVEMLSAAEEEEDHRRYISDHSSYMKTAFKDPQVVIDIVREQMFRKRYDTIIGTGMSGALVVPTVARALGKRWAIARKPNDTSHAWGLFEGELGHRWILLDDFVSSGETYVRTVKVVERFAKSERFDTKCVGVVEYERRSLMIPEHPRLQRAWENYGDRSLHDFS